MTKNQKETPLGGKKILLIGIGFYDYEVAIANEMRGLGAEVEVMSERPPIVRSWIVDAQIRSILDSLGPDDEIVVSDDGSTDGTRDIVTAIEDSRIRLLGPGTRLGYQGNFERAVKSSRGEFIFFSDQDDINLQARIPESLSALARCDCVCGDAILTDVNLNELAPSFFELRRARFGAFQLSGAVARHTASG